MVYSHSSLATFEQCKTKFRFMYLDKLEQEFTNKKLADIGSKVHLAIEHNDDAYVLDNMEAFVMFNYAKQLLNDIHEEKQFELHLACDKYGNHVNYDSSKALLHGVVDMVAGFKLYDWKTGYATPTPVQLGIYFLLATANDIKLDELIYIMLRKQTFSSLIPNYDLLSSTRKWLTQIISQIESETEFLPSPGRHCAFCPFSQKCSAENEIYAESPEHWLACYVSATVRRQQLLLNLKEFVQKTGTSIKYMDFEFGISSKETISAIDKKKLMDKLRYDGVLSALANIEPSEYPALLKQFPGYSKFFRRTLRDTIGFKELEVQPQLDINQHILEE